MARAMQLSILLAVAACAHAQTTREEEQHRPATTNENWSIHFQATGISQINDHFHSPYAGQNSLRPEEAVRTTYTGTVFLGARLWRGAEIYADPEVAGGKGLSGAVGAAGFPNGEATRVGNPDPTPYMARYFFRQRIDLGGDSEFVEADQHQLAGSVDKSNLTITFGKLAAGDIFDENAYSHDPRTQFMNWALMANGAWDFPADTRGYTHAFTIELNQPNWSVRMGTFMVPTKANGEAFDHEFGKASGNAAELERSYQILSKPGKVRLLAYLNSARMGSYNQALTLSPTAPDLEPTRAYRFKYGFGLNIEQQVTTNVGAFIRAGWNDGRSETWMFTEIDRTFSLGISAKGALWGRPSDTAGLAGVINGLSGDHRRFLAAGGYGFIVGDGQLNYSEEMILETYYSCAIAKWLFLTGGYEYIANPGYNADRGPAHVGTARLHVEF